MKSKTRTRALSWLLSLAMVLSLIPGMSIPAYAATLDNTSTTWSEDSTITDDTVTISGGVTVSADMTLTIPEGKTLTVNGGINAESKTLTVAGTGSLVVTGANGGNGSNGTTVYDGTNGTAGENGSNGITGNLVVAGANVTVTGGNGGSGGKGGDGRRAGKGGNGGNGGNGGSGVAGNVTVNSGSATVTGGNGGAGGTGGSGDYDDKYGDAGSAGTAGAAVTGTITGKAEDSADNSNWAAVTTGTSSNRYVKVSATGPNKTALNDAITAAETLYNGIKDNNDYTEIANTLKTAIETAQGVADNDEADQDAIDTATTAITTAMTDAVVGTLNALPAASEVTTSHKTTIEAARAAYNALDDAAKEKVTNYAKLTAAEAALVKAQAKADGVDYIITIPAKLSVKGDGWNPTDGVTAKLGSVDAFNSNKRLTVTAASANNWALKSGENSIGYKLATASADTKATTSWEFSADEITTAGTTKPMGIIVDDFSAKPAGKYTDTVTFTASVEDAVTITYRSIGTAFDPPRSMPANFTEVTLEEAQAYSQTITAPWLIIYARSGGNYKFITSQGVNSTGTWDDIVYGYSFRPGQYTSIIIPVTE